MSAMLAFGVSVKRWHGNTTAGIWIRNGDCLVLIVEVPDYTFGKYVEWSAE